jgi:UDP-3-O-[3-hydroxymyristoyl] glucosamine N-acyltransferase
MSFSVAELAGRVGGVVAGDSQLRIERVRELDDASAGDISFYSNRRYRRALEVTRASAVLVEPDCNPPAGRTYIEVPSPYLAFAKVSALFHPTPAAVPGIAPQAVIHPSADVHPTAQVMPLACVAAGARVGARTILHPGAVVGEGARIGDDCLLYANVVVREQCLVGNRCILQPGCVVGSDGFGFAFDPQGDGAGGPRHFKIPQAGTVVIEDDVEIGANTCVDRATLGRTVVGRGTKIDNLVQIAHNVEVGPLSLMAGQSGIAGSTKLGKGVVLGGQVGVVGHLQLGEGCRFGARTVVRGDVPAGASWAGDPAHEVQEWLREMAALRRLPGLLKRVKELEKRLAQLEERK